MIQFTTAPPSTPRMQPVMERLVQSVRARPTQKQPDLSSQSAAYRAGYYLGLCGFPVLLVVGGLVTAHLIARRSKERRSQTDPRMQ